MVANEYICPLLQRSAALVHHFLRLERRCVQHGQFYIGNGVKRPCNGIMLIAGDYHAASRLDQRIDGDIEAVGSVVGKDHILRLGHTKKLCRRSTAQIICLLSHAGGAVAATAGR